MRSTAGFPADPPECKHPPSARWSAAPNVSAIGETVLGYEAIAWQGLSLPLARHVKSSIGSLPRHEQIWALPDVIDSLQKLG